MCLLQILTIMSVLWNVVLLRSIDVWVLLLTIFELLNNCLGQIETHLRDVDLHLNRYNNRFDYSDNLIYAITVRMDIRYVEYCSFFVIEILGAGVKSVNTRVVIGT